MEHREWTGAIERVAAHVRLALRVREKNISMRLVAPLIGGIGTAPAVLSCPVDTPTTFLPPSRNGRQVVDRLTFRDKHVCRRGSRARSARVSHICCADELSSRATVWLTREGLIRSGTRHVKDDRRHRHDVTNYVLGWSLEDQMRRCRSGWRSAKAFNEAADKAAEAGRDAAYPEQTGRIDALTAWHRSRRWNVNGAKTRATGLQKKFTNLEQSLISAAS